MKVPRLFRIPAVEGGGFLFPLSGIVVSMKEVFLQDFVTLDSGIAGVLRLQDGVLGFYSKEESNTFVASQVDIKIDFGTIRLNEGNETYPFMRGVSDPDAHRALLVTPPAGSSFATRKILEDSNSPNKNDLVAFYDEDKYPNEIWATVLVAAGYTVSYRLGLLNPSSLKSRTLILVAAAATVVGILLAIAIRFIIS